MADKETKKSPHWRAELFEWLKSLAVAFILAMFIRAFFFQAFKIPSSSMEPTLKIGDHLIANKLVYRFRAPQRGDVVIFKFPGDGRRDFVKRLIGLPGETVWISDGRIYINGRETTEPRIAGRRYFNFENLPSVTVPGDGLFVLGDNSLNSYDSRYWGFVPRKNLIGKALFIYWPPWRWKMISRRSSPDRPVYC